LTAIGQRLRKTVFRAVRLLGEGDPLHVSQDLVSYHLMLDGRHKRLRIPLRTFTLPNGMRMLVTDDVAEAFVINFDENFIFKENWLLKNYRPPKGGVVVDVGAFCGLYTVTAAKLVGPKGRVYAVEPAPATFKLLQMNISLNGLKNIVPIERAVADFNGFSNLYIPHLHSSSSFYSNHLGGFEQVSKVRVTTLDDIIRDYKILHVDLMKVDIEGVELAALKGASDALGKGIVEKVVVELHEPLINYKDVLDYLVTKRFVVEAVFHPREGIAKKIVYARRM